jgi:hypothetical protein
MVSRVAGKNSIAMTWTAVCRVDGALSHLMEQAGTPSCPNVGKKFDGWRIACPRTGRLGTPAILSMYRVNNFL